MSFSTTDWTVDWVNGQQSLDIRLDSRNAIDQSSLLPYRGSIITILNICLTGLAMKLMKDICTIGRMLHGVAVFNEGTGCYRQVYSKIMDNMYRQAAIFESLTYKGDFSVLQSIAFS